MANLSTLLNKPNAWTRFVESNWFLLVLSGLVTLIWATGMTVAGIIVLMVLFSALMVTCRNTAPSFAVCLGIYASFSPEYHSLSGNEWMLALLALPVVAVVLHCVVYRPRLRVRGFGVTMVVSTIPWLVQGLVRRIEYSITGYFSPSFVWVAYLVVALLGGLFLLLYLFFDATCTTDFPEYLCKIMVFFAAIIVVQCAIFYAELLAKTPFAQLAEEVANGAKPLNLGWASNNNVGAILSLTIPITCYFAHKRTRLAAWLFAFALLQYAMLMLSFSRGPMLFVTIAMPFIVVYMLVRATPRQRLGYLVVLGITAALLITLGVVFRNMLAAFWEHLAAKKLDDSGRHLIWQNAIDTFVRYPVFGGGMDVYYYTDTAPWAPADPLVADNPFFFNRPGVPRWFHGTLWQTMASFGSLGLVAYAYQYAYRYALMWRMHKSPRQMWVLVGMVLFELYGLIDIIFFAPVTYFIIMLLTMGADKQGDYRPIRPLIAPLPRAWRLSLEKAGTTEPDDLAEA